jgi:hypothetical protein
MAGVALLASGPYILPEAYRAGEVATASTPDAIAAYRLRAVPITTYAERISAALESDDPELAGSLAAVADAQQVPLPDDLRARVADAQGVQLDRTLREAWKGLAAGDASSPEALAGAVAADLSGVGDARDLYREGKSYLEDGSYDPLTLGLAVVGLAATTATYLSIGAASPARVGVTALKFASKADAIRPPLRGAMIALAKDVIDRPALERSLDLLKQGDLAPARAALASSVRGAPLQSLKTMSTDVGTVIKANGYRAGRDVLALADTPADLGRYRALAGRLGVKFRGTLALLGAGALTLAGLTATLAGWLASAVLWLLATLYVLYRMGRRLTRLFRAKPNVS